MLVTFGGAHDGIRNYLEDGQKQGREQSRDELDQRMILSGDLAVTDSIIQSINSDGERYKHITLSFKEEYMAPEVLASITEDFKKFALSAYGVNEMDCYAEAHIPKIRSYVDKEGQIIERRPHIHIVIPTVNLVNGQRANPFGMLSIKYGSPDSTLQMLDAWQERTNQKYGLESPKDNMRADFSSKAEILSRAKGDDFHKKDIKIRQAILNRMVDNKIETREGFEKMLRTFGAVSIGKAGTPEQYFEVRLPSSPGEPANKKIRLKDHQFTDSYISMSTDDKRAALIKGRNAVELDPVRQAELAEKFQAKRSHEIKYLHTDSKFFKETYKAASEEEQMALLDQREAAHYEKLQRGHGYDRTTGEIDIESLLQAQEQILASIEQQAVKQRQGTATAAMDASGLPDLDEDNDWEDVPRISSERLNRGFLRTTEELKIAMAEGERCIAEPESVIEALTYNQSVFSQIELERYLLKNTSDDAQFDEALEAVLKSDPLVTQTDAAGMRFTRRDVAEIEAQMVLRVERMSKTRGAALNNVTVQAIAEGSGFNVGQKTAFSLLCSDKQVALVNGAAGTGKSYVLAKMRTSYEAEGFTLYGAILQGKTAEDLERDSGIKSQTMHSFLDKLSNTNRAIKEGESVYQYEKRHVDGSAIRLTEKSVVVVDEAGMIGSRQMAELMQYVEAAGARVRLVGDAKQLSAVEYGSAFKEVSARVDRSSLDEIMRQKNRALPDGGKWLCEASEAFSRHDVAAGIKAYSDRGYIKQSETQADAQAAIVERWKQLRNDHPVDSIIVLCGTNKERHALNSLMRAELQAQGKLQDEQLIKNDKGESLAMATGEGVMFTRNDKNMGVKNGTIGTVIHIGEDSMTVELADGRRVSVDTSEAATTYSYAITVHKSQGMTVNRCLGLAGPGMRAESVGVAMTRHKNEVELHYSAEHFADEKALIRSLERSGRKEFSGNDAWSATRKNDSLVSQYLAEHGAAEVIRQAARTAKFQEIKSNLDAKRVLDYVSKSHGIDPERYRVTKARDGSDRIECGKRHYTVAEFLTKEVALDYLTEAAPILKACYADQLAHVYSTARYAPGERLQNKPLFQGFKNYRKAQDIEYKTASESLDADKIARRSELVRTLEKNKADLLLAEATKGQTRMAVAALRREHKAALMDASASFKESKRILNEKFKKPATEVYKDFVAGRAAQGSALAMDELRRTVLSDADKKRMAHVEKDLHAASGRALTRQLAKHPVDNLPPPAQRLESPKEKQRQDGTAQMSIATMPIAQRSTHMDGLRQKAGQFDAFVNANETSINDRRNPISDSEVSKAKEREDKKRREALSQSRG